MRGSRGAVLSGAARVLAVLGVLGAGAPAVAGQVGEELTAVAEDLAMAWQAGRTADLAARMTADGIRLHVPGASHPVLPVRLARAALDDLHRQVGRGPASVRQARRLGGVPVRGLVEMEWRPLPDGVTEPMGYTIFLGLEEREREWRVVEIRVMPAEGAPRPRPRGP